jgi:hypothetical protein
MTRRQLSPPSALSHKPLPIVPAQIVYLPDIVVSSLFTVSTEPTVTPAEAVVQGQATHL